VSRVSQMSNGRLNEDRKRGGEDGVESEKQLGHGTRRVVEWFSDLAQSVFTFNEEKPQKGFA